MTIKQLVVMFIMTIVTSALVTAGTLFGTVWYLTHSDNVNQKDKSFLASLPFMQESKPKAQPAIFHPLDKVVLSVKGRKQTHFVMLEIAIETHDPKVATAIDNYMPVIRNALLKLFSHKVYEDLYGDNVIVQLQKEVKQSVLNAFMQNDEIRGIDDVLLTKFVVQ